MQEGYPALCRSPCMDLTHLLDGPMDGPHVHLHHLDHLPCALPSLKEAQHLAPVLFTEFKNGIYWIYRH